MKILYAIQGTGNGHISRARDIVPLLREKGTLHILVSGTESDISLPFPVEYELKGLSFVFGKKGGIDLLKTYRKSSLKRLYAEIKNLPIENYDLVINDFEPVSAWAAFLKGVPCIGLSHQAAVIHKEAPRPKNFDLIGKAVLHNYAPVNSQFGFHFDVYASTIFTPVIRSQIRKATAIIGDHYTVYLPAYDISRIIKILKAAAGDHTIWHIFSKHIDQGYVENNFHVFPVSNDLFIESFISCKGIICGAGFETPAEAMFLNKKLLVVPMKGQFEQQCNAAALQQLGVPVIKSLKSKHTDRITNWVLSEKVVSINYPDKTKEAIEAVFAEYEFLKDTYPLQPIRHLPPEKKFRKQRLAQVIEKITG